MSIAEPTSGEQRLLLHNVGWRCYETFLGELANHSAVRLTYDHGNLEIMTPSYLHEYHGRLIEMLTYELNIPIASGGSTTFRREELDRGLEPDACYYIANERAIRDKTEIDLSIDPPPDLAVEIDITSSSLNRQDIYGALGVSEIWRFDGTSLRVHALQADGEYQVVDRSPSFPFLPLKEFTTFLLPKPGIDQNSRLREFTEWVRAEVSPGFER